MTNPLIVPGYFSSVIAREEVAENETAASAGNRSTLRHRRRYQDCQKKDASTLEFSASSNIPSMISKILPASVVSVEQFGHHSGVLWDEEERALGRAVASRRQEFATGRTCARMALAALGVRVQPILRGPRREPLWPEGIVGSITHCEGYSVAAVARRENIVSIGIDAEPNQTLPEGVLALIARQEEIELLRCISSEQICWDRLLFSAKESLYKAWYPLMKCWLGFDEVSLTFDPDGGSFQMKVLATTSRFSGLRMSGRYFARRDYIATSVTITSAAAT